MVRKKIEDLGKVISGGTPSTKNERYWGGDIAWITPKDLSKHDSMFIFKGERGITEEGLKNSSAYTVPTGTVLFSSRAPIGYVAIAGKNLTTNQGFKNIVVNDENDNLFIYYLLKNNIKFIESHANGSTFKEISAKVFKNLEFDVPNLDTQRKISKILSTLDSKIELNNQIISNLEELASTLFKRWFVDFEFPDENGNPYKSSGGKMVDSELGKIPEGWELRTLGYFSEIIMGQSPKGESYNNDNSGLPLLNGASDFKNGIISPLKYTTEPKKVTQKGDFIFGVRATVGHVTESDGIYAIGRGTGLARTKNYYAKEFLYFSLKNIIRYLELTASGSVYVNISKKELNDFKLIYPANRILQLFHRTTVNLFKEKMNKYIENQFLTELRDSLLPKLLSGEIELPEDEEM
ncbi:TPA: restriction endonuclease subunit S [Enterococcus faecalis]|uniref:restriction endonuclease subunit S n=1 Tax=Enterococcus faecalis TaxID=1351 RepID=UPI00094B3B20|nr:restriction endonuclease subunit S [Enterococcus faecalis]EHQ8831188.1 restriction endonuclease subunit S [Enterococcus faecalis]HBI1544706.1 restriction endonuclease subunit S [Enterococcus faecalis]HBI1637058.1 restriction endonuclease subunit S [Enterococcus faecalis]HBI1639585.1 restriction endonuclease subunit S [Enterococcus faecalis]HBI1641592.1 restriction endonuclease subunit S [Enterococcus faecalis]